MNRLYARILSSLLALMLFVAPGFGMAEEVEDPVVWDYPYKTISCQVQGGNAESADIQLIYSDGMFMRDAVRNEPDPELAKISVAMASAAYAPNNAKMNAILGYSGMGFTRVRDVNYSRSMPITDCHHVAFSIWVKQIGGYTVYCVPIRGTPDNGEWYSDFLMKAPLGVTGYENKHYGFHKAAEEVLEYLNMYISGQNVKVLVTGHSRGAAVANIVEAELTKKIFAENVYGYNFACPAVSMSVSNYGNIFNFNNDGDMIPTMPLESWKYYRNGKDIKRPPMEESGFACLFEELSHRNYSAASSSHPYIAVFNKLVPTVDDYDDGLLPLLIVGYLAGGSKSSDLNAVYDYYQSAYVEHNPGEEFVFHFLFPAATVVSSISDLITNATSNENRINHLYDFLCKYQNSFDSWLEDQVNEFREEYAEEIEMIEDELDLVLNSSAQFRIASQMYSEMKTQLTEVKESIEEIAGKIGSAVFDGHDPFTYVAWINSRYFGYHGCKNVPSILFPIVHTETVGPGCFEGVSASFPVVMMDDVRYISPGAFADCTGLSEITLSHGLTAIGAETFSGCTGLTAIEIPSNIERLEDSAFSGCTGLTSVTLEDGLQAIGSRVFSGCTGLTELTIPDSVQSMGASCLPSDIQTLTIPFIGISNDHNGISGYSLRTLLDDYFSTENNTLRHLTITNTTLIPYAAANYMRALETVSLPDNLEIIESHAFDYCSSLTDIVFPDGLKTIGDSAFYECTSLTELVIPASVERLGNMAFLYCPGVTGITLSEGLTTIGDYVFNSCTAVTEMTIPDSVQTMGRGCLPSGLQTLTLPFMGQSRDDSSGNLYYLFSTNANDGNDTLKNLTITDMTSIPEFALYKMRALESVSLPDMLESIGMDAFGNCTSLQSIVLPDSLRSIGYEAFYKCDSLTSVSYPSAEVRDFLLEGAGNVPNDAWVFEITGKLTLPAALTEIEGDAFRGAGAAQIILHAGVETVRENAFAGSPSLRYVIVEGEDTAFEGAGLADSPNAVVLCLSGSAAAQWCEQNGVPCRIK